MQKSDAQLVSLARRGDRSSFDMLVERHYTLAYNTAYRMLDDVDSASDATQAAFVRAYKSLGSFRGRSAFSTWLYRIVCNVCLDLLRNRRNDVVSLDVAVESPDGTSLHTIPDVSAKPDLSAERSERQRCVHAALRRLSAEYRGVVVLFDLLGFSYDEIADILQIPLGTVKSRLNRARLALKDTLAEDMELFG